MQIGDKIKFEREKQRYTVVACDDRFAILRKPFNAQKTYLYTITDLKKGVRGACNMIFGLPVCLDEEGGAEENLRMLQSGEMSVSARNYVPLLSSEIQQLKQ